MGARAASRDRAARRAPRRSTSCRRAPRSPPRRRRRIIRALAGGLIRGEHAVTEFGEGDRCDREVVGLSDLPDAGPVPIELDEGVRVEDQSRHGSPLSGVSMSRALSASAAKSSSRARCPARRWKTPDGSGGSRHDPRDDAAIADDRELLAVAFDPIEQRGEPSGSVSRGDGCHAAIIPRCQTRLTGIALARMPR